MSAWSCLVYETTTGDVVDELPLASPPTYSRMLGEAGSISVDVKVRGRWAGTSISASDLRQYLTGWRHSLAVVWNGAVIQAGPITAHQDPDDGNGVVRIGAVGLRQVLNRRVLKPAGVTTTIMIEPLIILSGSLHTILKRLISYALADGPLPVVLPADIPGSQVRQYTGRDLAYAGTEIDELRQEDGGPEEDWAPRFRADGHGIEHVVRIGDPLLEESGGEPWSWDYGSSLVSLPTSSDASRMSHRVWERGSGSGGIDLVGFAQDLAPTTLGVPLLDYVGSATREVEFAVLNARAAGEVADLRSAVSTWDATVLADPGDSDRFPALSALQPGGWGLFGVYGHLTVPDGDYRWRVLGFADAGEDRVRLTVADRPEVV